MVINRPLERLHRLYNGGQSIEEANPSYLLPATVGAVYTLLQTGSLDQRLVAELEGVPLYSPRVLESTLPVVQRHADNLEKRDLFRWLCGKYGLPTVHSNYSVDDLTQRHLTIANDLNLGLEDTHNLNTIKERISHSSGLVLGLNADFANMFDETRKKEDVDYVESVVQLQQAIPYGCFVSVTSRNDFSLYALGMKYGAESKSVVDFIEDLQ